MTICATRTLTMPTAHPDPPPATWFASIMLAVGGLFGIVGAWITGYLGKRTALEVKKLDRQGVYTDDLRDDLKAMQFRIDALQKEWFESKTEAIALREQIAHLRNQIEQLENTVVRYQADLTERDTIVEQLRAQLAEKDAEIGRLKQNILDLQVIGVGEVAPPKRFKATGGAA